MCQNLLEKCFERMGEIIVRTEDVSLVSSKTKNINNVGLDMSSHMRKNQATANADNIMVGYISLSKDKNISKGIQEMPILQKKENVKNNNLIQGKNQDNSPPMDKLLLKGENPDDILFFPEEETEKISINPTVILSYMEKGYLTFSEFIYNNPNGKGYYQTSIESIYPRIMIIDQADPILIQNAINYGFVDRIYLSKDCNEISYDTLKSQLCNLRPNHNCYAKFFSISPEYNEDNRIVIKAFHVITLNSSEETRVQINDNKPKKIGQLNRQWIKTKIALGVKVMLGRMIGLRKKNCSIHCAARHQQLDDIYWRWESKRLSNDECKDNRVRPVNIPS